MQIRVCAEKDTYLHLSKFALDVDGLTMWLASKLLSDEGLRTNFGAGETTRGEILKFLGEVLL